MAPWFQHVGFDANVKAALGELRVVKRFRNIRPQGPVARADDSTVEKEHDPSSDISFVRVNSPTADINRCPKWNDTSKTVGTNFLTINLNGIDRDASTGYALKLIGNRDLRRDAANGLTREKNRNCDRDDSENRDCCDSDYFTATTVEA